jgi:DNA-binding NtrC family response regulator
MANILVIDDEEILLDLICTTLRRDNHTVTAMLDADAICDAYKTKRLTIDLLLTDVSMKPIGGFELVRRLNLVGFNGSVLFMSGYSGLSGVITESLGSRALIEKPFTAAQLRAAVSKALPKTKLHSVPSAWRLKQSDIPRDIQ